MGAVVLLVLVLQTFACGVMVSRLRDLKDENDLLRESMPFYHTKDWPSVEEVPEDGK